jgi:hypothetical protein
MELKNAKDINWRIVSTVLMKLCKTTTVSEQIEKEKDSETRKKLSRAIVGYF